MKPIILFILPILIISKREILFETIQTIADNLNPRFNNINPNDYSFQLLDSLLEFQIKNITSIVSYESRLISTTNNIPTITYIDLNVTLYFYLQITPIEKSNKKLPLLFKKGLYANLFYTQFELSQSLDGTLYFIDTSPGLVDIDLGDMKEYILFKELYKNKMDILQKQLITGWVQNLRGILDQYPKGYPTIIFESLISTLYTSSDYSLETVEGITKARLRDIQFKERTTTGAAQKFNSVSMKVIYSTKEHEMSEFEYVIFDYVILSKENFIIGKVSPIGKIGEAAKEILNRVFREYID